MKNVKINLPNLFHIAVSGGIVVLFALQVWFLFSFAKDLLFPILSQPNRTYEEKRLAQNSDYFGYMLFVQKETPEDAVILLNSNIYQTLDLYFLYPRQLIYGGKAEWQTHPTVQYIVVRDNYPNFPIAGTRIMLDDQRGLIRLEK